MSTTESESLTPWSTLRDVRAIRIHPMDGPATGAITIPGSKSFTNRALILAGMSEGASRLSGLLLSDDTYWCVDALTRLGVKVRLSNFIATVTGIGRQRPRQQPVHVGSAGTVARFLPGFLAAGEKGQWRITASEQMQSRPVAALFDTLAQGGAVVSFLGEPGCFPVVVNGDTFRGGRLSMSGSTSSQFISGILMAAPQSRDGVQMEITDTIVQSEYVRITLDLMQSFGASVEAAGDLKSFSVRPAPYKARDLAIEPDASTATYFAALAAVTGGHITLNNLSSATRQPDYQFLNILERMGCLVTRGRVATSVTGAKPLTGGFTADMRPLSDAALTLAAIAPFADAPITITGVEHIRHHESDRIAAISQSLTALGVPVQEHRDGLTISPATPGFAVLDTYDDHRVAMALTVLGAAANGVELLNPSCVSKTCPMFFDLVASIGGQTELKGPHE